VSHTSGVDAHPLVHTPGGKEHCQEPPEHVTLTPDVHSGLIAVGLTPQTCDGKGAMTASSIWPLQLSSTLLHCSDMPMKTQAYSQS
jgi:hypothetical protein